MKNLTQKLVALLCVLSMALSLVPMAAQAAEPAPEWALLTEDFEAFDEGEGAFATGMDSNLYSPLYSNGNAAYNIAEGDAGGKYLQMQEAGTDHAGVSTAFNISGEYSVQFDYLPVNASAAGPFDVRLIASGGDYIRARLGLGGNRIRSDIDGIAHSGTISGLTFANNTWYTVKAIVRVGAVTLKVWNRDGGSEASAKSVTLSNDLITEDMLAAGQPVDLWLGTFNTAPSGDPYTCGIDNLVISKPTDDIHVEPTVYASVGETFSVAVQSETKPLPQVELVSENEKVVRINAKGEAVGIAAGTANLTAYLKDLKGVCTAASFPVTATVSEVTEWVKMDEDFSSYAVGNDTFYNINKTAYTFSDSYHNAETMTYNIAEENGDPYLKMCLTGNSDCVRFDVNDKMAGPYTMQFDYMTPNGTPAESGNKRTDFLDVGLFGNSDTTRVRARLNYSNGDNTYRGAYLYSQLTGASSSGTMKDSTGEKFAFAANTWYTVKIDVAVERITMKIWKRGTAEPMGTSGAGIVSLASDKITADLLHADTNEVYFSLGPIAASGENYACGIDNITIRQATELTVSGEMPLTTDKTVELSEADIGKTYQLSATATNGIRPNIKWTSSDPAAVSVSPGGLVTIEGTGEATISASALDINGNRTFLRKGITFRIGDETPTRILFIGNSFSYDTSFYMSSLAKMLGKNLETSILHRDSCTLAQHAFNMENDNQDYYYYTYNAYTGTIATHTEDATANNEVTIRSALENKDWDYIIFQQGVESAGYPGTYNGDLYYLLDSVRAYCPNAKFIWNMTWALQESKNWPESNSYHKKDFDKYYDGSQKMMYNSIASAVDEKIVNGEFKDRFDMVFYTGAAVQNVRATSIGDTMNRDGLRLDVKKGRLTAAMTAVKTLFPDANLDLITAEKLDRVLVNEYSEDHPEWDNTYVNTNANLALIKEAVTDAIRDGAKPIDAPEPTQVSNAKTVWQNPAPLALRFPDVATLADGTLVATAYENVIHAPNKNYVDGEGVNYEGKLTLRGTVGTVGRLRVLTSKDNGATWTSKVVVDEHQLEQWGLTEVSQRYAKLKANPTGKYTTIADPRDGNLTTVQLDMNKDGKTEDVLLLTFWVASYGRDYLEKMTVPPGGNTCYLTYSTDGGNTWAKPYLLGKGAKRGDIAQLGAGGDILVPTYSDNNPTVSRLQWTGSSWKQIAKVNLVNTGSKEDTVFNEVSLVCPDGKTVYAFARSAGVVQRSTDGGRTWVEIANEDGTLVQPGFAVMDESRVFVTYARTEAPRYTYGKTFYVGGGWNDVDTQCIYKTNAAKSDTGDPSCTMMKDGKIFVIAYDVAYRSIVGVIVDPNTAPYLPKKMSESKMKILFSDNFENSPVGAVYASTTLVTNAEVAQDGAARVIPLNGMGIRLVQKITGDYALDADIKLNSAEASFSVELPVGTVTVTPGKISVGEESAEIALVPGELTHLTVNVVGKLACAKAWQGDSEPEEWMAASAAEEEKDIYIGISGVDAALDELVVRQSEEDTPIGNSEPISDPLKNAKDAKFIDVAENDWFFDAVQWVKENGMMNGVSETEFAPNAEITRAQFVTALWRQAGSIQANLLMPYADVPEGEYYTEAVRWAAAKGLVKGVTETEFAPNAPITREQMATILYRDAQSKGQGFTGSWMFLLDYVDRAEISDWADEAMHWCSMKGILTGKDGNRLAPKDNATRAEFATIMMRMSEKAE